MSMLALVFVLLLLVVQLASAAKFQSEVLNAKFSQLQLIDLSELLGPLDEAHDPSKKHTVVLQGLSELSDAEDTPAASAVDELTLTIQVDKSMFHEEYKEIIMSPESQVIGTLATSAPECYYRGHVVGMESGASFVHFSACHPDKQIHGFVSLQHNDGSSSQYYIEPLRAHGIDLQDQSSNEDEEDDDKIEKLSHVVFRSKHMILEEEQEQGTCGVTTSHADLLRSDTHRAVLSTGECNNAATKEKYVEMVIANDDSLYALIGETLEQHSADVFAAAQAIYADTSFACDVLLRLKGQISFRAGTVDEIVRHSCGDTLDYLADLYNGNEVACCDTGVCDCDVGEFNCLGTNDGGDLNEPGCYSVQRGSSTCGSDRKIDILNVPEVDSVDPDEVSHSELLRTFGKWGMETMATELEDVFGEIDNMHLFTGLDFAGATVGFASVAGMCQGTNSAGVEQMSGSVTYDSAVFAHELGHNFGMQHDDACSGSDCFIMNSVIVSPPPDSFSSLSRQAADDYFEDDYDVSTGREKCLDNEPNRVYGIEKAFCGNGIVEAGESCDEGTWAGADSDACCDQSTCSLEPGCECANSQPCCDNGSFRSSTFVCREKKGDCDLAEKCTGSSGDCPINFFLRAGTSCKDSSEAGNVDGVCYGGKCLSEDGVCTRRAVDYPFGSPNCGELDCGKQYYCRASSDATSCVTKVQIPPDGYPCANAGQCYNGFCEASSNLRLYYWVVGEWTTKCVNNENSRSVQCKSEESQRVGDSKCSGTRPPSRRLCDGTLIDATSGEYYFASSSSSSYDPEMPLRSLCLPNIPCACPTLNARHNQVLNPASGQGQPNATVTVSCPVGYAFPLYPGTVSIAMRCTYDFVNYSSWNIALPRCLNESLIEAPPSSSFDGMIIVYIVLALFLIGLAIFIFRHRDCLSKPPPKQQKYADSGQAASRKSVRMSVVAGAARGGAGAARPSMRPGMKAPPPVRPGMPKRKSQALLSPEAERARRASSGGPRRPSRRPIQQQSHFGPVTPQARPSRSTLAPLGASSRGALPSGWKEVTSSKGKVYYYHKATKTTQWTRPHK